VVPATEPVHQKCLAPITLKRIPQLPGDNPCPCSRNTNFSSELTIRPSNSQSLHCNRRVRTMSCNPHLDSGNLFREPGNTTASWGRSIQLANSQNHPRNCTGLPELAVASVGHRCGESCNTRTVWLGPKRSTARLHNCMDRQVQQVQAALWGAAAGASGAAWAGA